MSDIENKVRQLVDMGFDEETSRDVLNELRGDMEGAIEILSEMNKPPEPAAPIPFNVGDEVEVNSRAGNVWYSGRIERIRDDDIYGVLYDVQYYEIVPIVGQGEGGIPPEFIRRRQNPVDVAAVRQEPDVAAAARPDWREQAADLVAIEPFATTNLCISIQNALPRADIYCLRYQTFSEIMDVITRVMRSVFDTIVRTGYTKYIQEIRTITTVPSGLIRIGYFMIKYTADNKRLLLYRITEGLIITAFKELHINGEFITDFLSDQQFNIYRTLPDFNELLLALVKKVFFECRIRKNLHNVNFSQCFSLDLFPTRGAGRLVHGFHIDAVPTHMSVSLFSLTYLLEPRIVIKGPTIVKRISSLGPAGQLIDLRPSAIQANPDPYVREVLSEEAARRVQLTLAVKNGTTIAIDNDIYIHTTPDIYVRTTRGSDERAPDVIEPQSIHDRFNMVSVGKSRSTRRDFDESKARIELNTRETNRSFIRTWFIRSFPSDVQLQGDEDENEYPTLTTFLERQEISNPGSSLLCDTMNTRGVPNCNDLRDYVGTGSPRGLVDDHIFEYKDETSIVALNQYEAPEIILESIAKYVSLGGAKDGEQNNDTCSIVKKSTDDNFEEKLEEILDSTGNLIIGELPDTIKGGLLIRKMRKARKTKKIRKFRKTKKIRKINKKRKAMQSKRKRKYKK